MWVFGLFLFYRSFHFSLCPYFLPFTSSQCCCVQVGTLHTRSLLPVLWRPLQPPCVAQADLTPSLLVLQPTERVGGLCLLVPKHELDRKEGSPRPRIARPSYNPGSLGQTKSRARAALEFPSGDIEVRCVGFNLLASRLPQSPASGCG